MKTRFIINPIAGTGKQKNITNYINKHFNDYDIVYTKKTGDAIKLSIEAKDKKFDSIIAVGGDGTLNECVQACVNSEIKLGIIPCGSGNGFANHIGMSSMPEKAMIQLNNSSILMIDSCIANKKYFINVSGIGFDAHIANLFSKIKTRGLKQYIRLIIRELKYNPKEYTIRYDKKEIHTNAYLIAFANASQYGNNFHISPESKIDDGLINFVIVKGFSKWHIPNFILKMSRGNLHNSKYVNIIKSKSIEILSNDTLIHLDGEPYTTSSPFNIKLLPKSLKMLIPNEKE